MRSIVGGRSRLSLARDAALLMGVVALLSGCLGWTQWGYDAGRTSNNAQETALTAGTVGGLTELWRAQPGAIHQTAVVVKGSRLVAVADNHTYGIDTATGQTVWTQPVGTRLAIRGEVVFTQRWAMPGDCESAALEAWDLESGVRRPEDDILAWEDEFCDGPSTETFGSRYVLSAGSGFDEELRPIRTTRVYDLETGAHALVGNGGPVTMDEDLGGYVSTSDGDVMMFPLPGRTSPGWIRNIQVQTHGGATAVLADGVVYVVRPGGTTEFDRLQALDAMTGADLWAGRGLVQPADQQFGKPAVRDGQVFATYRGSNVADGELRVYEDCGADLCEPLWTSPSDGLLSDPVVAGDLVYVVTREWDASDAELRIYSVDGCGAATCDPLHTEPLAATGGVDGVLSEVVVVDGRVYVSSPTAIVALGLPAS